MDRGTGETTRQMKAAPNDAVFIWCNGALSYPKHLANQLGRNDLKIVGPEWLTSDRWRGLELTGIVVDHALTMSSREFAMLREVKTRIRPR